MPSPQVLQPVLKKKVDELFLNWLSNPETQSTLKEYLDLIKSGQYVKVSSGEAQEKKSLSFNENNNVASHKKLAEKKPVPSGTPSTSQSSSTLPTRSSTNARGTGLNGRVSRRSVSTKKVEKSKMKKEVGPLDGFFFKEMFRLSSKRLLQSEELQVNSAL